MTYNVFGGTLSLAQSQSVCVCVCFYPSGSVCVCVCQTVSEGLPSTVPCGMVKTMPSKTVNSEQLLFCVL